MSMCCCEMGDGELASVSETKMRRARKPHRCCECGETIEPGETHHWVRGLWDGCWETYRTCLVCHQIKQDYFCSWAFGALWEAVGECLGHECIDPDYENPWEKRRAGTECES